MAAERSVPLATVTFAGHRYVAEADLGLAQPVPLMVHGNGRVFLSLTHAVAERVFGGPVSKQADYGYTARGSGSIDVPRMSLGGVAFEHIAGVPVFDFVDEPDAPVQGMLGTRFLVAARAAVDFTTDTMLLGVAATDGPDAALVGRGYASVPMRVGEDFRVLIDVRIPAIDRMLPITPSTVAGALTLHRPLFEGRIPLTPSGPADRSPGGTSTAMSTSGSVEFEVGGARCRSAATFEDLAEYANVPEGELVSYGMLGYDWMRLHRAILDYANRVLYFVP